MIVGYLVEDAHETYAKIVMITYERRGEVMVTGIKKLGNLIGTGYYCPTRSNKSSVFDSLEYAANTVRGYAERRRAEYEELIKKLDALTAAVGKK